jgi:hypothetical protein
MKNTILTPEQQEVLVGSLLGDANLQTETNGQTWRLRIIQKDKDYLFHKYEIFQMRFPPKEKQNL